MLATTTRLPGDEIAQAVPDVSALESDAVVRQILNRRPSVGLALGVVRDGRLEFFHGHGLADIGSGVPVTEDTVFRIASLTKVFTAIAILQLWEQGLVDLDAPANAFLRAYRLVPARVSDRPATLRHLLTHTAGIPEVVRASALLHPGWGPFGARPAVHSVAIGDPLPSLADYYRGGLQLVVEPGTDFSYTNHGFATLGQIVEDVTGTTLAAYLRQHIFEPLAMTDTDLLRSEQVRSRLATGYVLGPRGATAIADREWVSVGSSGIYSSARDIARFVAALLGGGSNEHGSMLQPATIATMFEPHYRPDPRVPGIGLAFFRGTVAGHRTVEHDGVLPGFNAHLLVAPDDGVGVFGLTNGSSGAFTWLPVELRDLLRQLLHLPDAPASVAVPQRPETWERLCGRYQLPARISDVRGRLVMGGGAQVFVRGGRLMVRLLTPVPALFRGFPLDPDDPQDPFVFRLHLSALGMPVVRVVFSAGNGAEATAVHIDLGSQPMSLYRQPPMSRGPGAARAICALAVLTAVTATRRRRGRRRVSK